MSNTFSKRLKDLRKAFGMTQIELAQKFNIANGTVGNWESGNRQPDYETLQKIADFFNVSIDYLLDISIDTEAISRARQTVKNLAEEKNIPFEEISNKLGETYTTFRSWYNGFGDKFNEASKLAKVADLYGVSIDFLLGREDKKENTTPDIKSNIVFLDNDKVRMLPLFESVSAGFGVNAIEEIQGYIPCYIENDYEAENSMCIKVWGDSMSPKIESGDVIQVVKQTSVDNGSIAVVLIDGEEGLVKRVVYGKTWIELHSINPMYPVQRFDGQEVERVSVVGLVRKIIKDV